MQICAHSYIMSDFNITNAGNTNVLDPGKVLETADKSFRKGHEHSYDRESAVSYSWDDDDNDVITCCEHENSETTNKRLPLLLDNQLEKMHIDTSDFSTGITEIPESSGVTQLNMQDFEAQNCQKISADKTDGNNVENHDCDTYKNYVLNGSGASQLLTVQRGKPLLPPNSVSSTSGNELSYILPSGTQSTIASPSKSNETCCSKQNLPSLLKSQSLDLYNGDCAIINIDQHLHNHHLPNITEHRSIESQFQLIAPSTDLMKHCQDEIIDKYAGELRQRPAQRPNIASTLFQSAESRPIYPNVPYSPYGSPYSSPRPVRRRPPLRESRRISIEKSGSFLQLNQYKLMDQIGQVIKT